MINLFKDDTVSSIKQTFSIGGEADLDECWHYFHLYHDDLEQLHYFLELFYKFSYHIILADEKHFFELIEEKSENYYYLTIFNKEVASSFALFLNNKEQQFLCDNEKITIRLEKTPISQEAVPSKDRAVLKRVKVDEILIPPFEFIDNEELSELFILCEDMQDVITNAKRYGFVDDLYIRIRSYVSLFCLSLNNYSELVRVAQILQSFSILINNEKEGFLNLNSDQILLIEGFIFNIERWLKVLFVEGGVEISFMDDSFDADFQTIKMSVSTLEQEEHVDEDALADIFDF